MTKSKIFHVFNSSFVIPFFLGDQINYFQSQGNEIYVSCTDSEHAQKYAQEKGFKYFPIKILRKISVNSDLIAVCRLMMIIRKERINIVVGHTPKGALLALLASRIMRVPVRIYFRHGLVYETMTGMSRWIMINLDRLTSFCSTKVICVSPSLYERSIKDKLCRKSKQVILNKGTCTGIDSQLKFNPELIDIKKISALRQNLQIKDNVFVIGYCGRLVRDKGICDLINAFQLLQDRMNNLELLLLLIGGFEERDSLDAETIKKIKESPKIRYTGWLYEEVENYYALMDVFVLPSYREGFPTSVLEASSLRKAVLTTRVTGCIDSIINEVTGRFIENNPDSISENIEFYIKNPEVRIEHGMNGREFVTSNFDQTIIWGEIEKQFKLD